MQSLSWLTSPDHPCDSHDMFGRCQRYEDIVACVVSTVSPKIHQLRGRSFHDSGAT